MTEEVKTNETDLQQEENDKVKKEKKSKKVNKNDEEILKLNELLGQEKEKSMRIQAEMMNFKRRKEEEVKNMYKYANEDILKSMLSVIDNFERALNMKSEENQEFLKGFEMIYTSIVNILNDNGVTEIKALDEAFDPAIHQAVFTEARDGVEAGIVIEVLQKGYMYKERVLRPSMVKVSE